VAKGELIRRAGGVFVVAGSVPSWRQRIACAAIGAAQHTRRDGGPIGAASHLSAAKLHGFRSVDSQIEVSVRHPRKLTIGGAVVVRSRDLIADDITWVDSIPSTTPERTICDLGLRLPEPEVMRILRHAVATQQVTARDVLQMRIRIGEHGRNGAGIIGRCLDALPALAEETESGLEVMFVEMCERHRVPMPVLQLPVVANGRSYRLDFAYPASKVFVEIDGAGHGTPTQISKDGGRQNDLVAHGWQPIRFDYQQMLRDPESSAQVLLELLRLNLCPESAK